VEPKKVLVLVDWGFAGPIDTQSPSKVHGTPYTMSQKILASLVLAKLDGEEDPEIKVRFEGLAGSRIHTAQDELESAVKSLLLILLPSLKLCIRQGVLLDITRRSDTPAASDAATYVKLWDCWQELLGATGVLELCHNEDYEGVIEWFSNRERLLFWQ